MAQLVKTPATKSDDLSSILRTSLAEGETDSCKPPSDPLIYAVVHTYASTQTHTLERKASGRSSGRHLQAQ